MFFVCEIEIFGKISSCRTKKFVVIDSTVPVAQKKQLWLLLKDRHDISFR